MDECTYYVPTSGNLSGSIGLDRTKTGLKTEGAGEKQFPPPPPPNLFYRDDFRISVESVATLLP
jgi:hypothetical protein